MIQRLKNLILAAVLPLTLAAPLALAPATALAANACEGTIGRGLNQGITSATGSTSGTACDEPTSGNGLSGIASKVVNFLSVIVGVVAVIMIIVGGFRYITSGGESGNVSGAKNTLIYAIVGLIIVALAQFIVHFVLSNLGSTSN